MVSMHHPLGDGDLGIFLKLIIRHADSLTRGQVFGREELEMRNEWNGRVGCRTEWMFFFFLLFWWSSGVMRGGIITPASSLQERSIPVPN